MLGELLDVQVKKTAKMLGIPVDFIIKDYYVTLAIQALCSVKDPYFDLIFNDLHQLQSQNLLSGKYKNLINDIIEKDISIFKKHDNTYNKNPIQASQDALATLYNDPQWLHHWDNFCEQMVYETNKHNFFEAINTLQLMSQKILHGKIRT